MAKGQRQTRRRPRVNRSGSADPQANIYDAMLAEASVADEDNLDRPPKRRPRQNEWLSRHAKPDQLSASPAFADDNLSSVPSSPLRPQQYVDASDSNSDSDESELEFEDVELNPTLNEEPIGSNTDRNNIEDVSVALESTVTPTKRVAPRRKKASPAEKAHRLIVHKLNILCLLGHAIFRNSWCNDKVVHAKLRNFPDPQVIQWMTLGPNKSQFERNRWFLKGIEELALSFRAKFRITASGLRKARWLEPEEHAHADVAEYLGRDLFARSADSLTGSQDMGNALFCAMLRSIGVEARLVCSLQPLPFDTASVNKGIPQKLAATPMSVSSSDGDIATLTPTRADNMAESSHMRGVPSARRRLGQPSLASANSQPRPPRHRVAIQKLSYPVYWIEVFNAAHQKWLPVDPIVTQTINQAHKLEPPVSYALNQMSYVVALERDGTGRDVTHRYAKAYNAKTRRLRVDCTEEGTAWWESILRFFRRSGHQRDREQVEDAELIQKASKEGFPKNVQDFKDHPVYALERHLKRHEVLHPRRSVGRVNVASNANPIMEEVFRRQDVLTCHSADKWYRLGRELKELEQPVKHVKAQGQLSIRDEGLESDAPQATRALYAYTQTRPYIPPPVVRGKVPRNAYGNLDIYVPSMIPSGGVHIRHELAQQAARILHIDYADAVTGFQFKSRRGVAIIEGVVVASEFEDAMWTTIDGFHQVQEEDQSMVRSLAALKMWKRFLTVLRVRERISAYGDLNEAVDAPGDLDMGDPDRDASDAPEDVAMPTAGRYTVLELGLATKPVKKQKRPRQDDSEELEVGTEMEEISAKPRMSASSDVDSNAGGFLFDAADQEDYGSGGGFLLDEDDVGDDNINENDAPIIEVADAAYESGGGGGFIVASDGDEEGAASHVEPTPGLDDQDQRPANVDVAGRALETVMNTENEAPTLDVATRTAQVTLESHADETGSARSRRQSPAMTIPEETATDGTATLEADSTLVNTLDQKNESGSEQGSMLSHDPDDDDAEPDWLESE